MDVTNNDSVRLLIEAYKPDAVVHLAAELKDESRMQAVNVVGSQNIAVACRDFGVKRLVFTSTCAVYHQASLEPTKETENIAPTSKYGRTKLQAEQKILHYFPDAVILRLFNVYGVDGDCLIDRLVRGEKVNVINGEYYRDWVHIGDVIGALRRSVEGDMIGIFNLGGECMSNREVVGRYGDKNVQWVDGVPSYSRADMDKIRVVFGTRLYSTVPRTEQRANLMN